jgi:hypothetical protein
MTTTKGQLEAVLERALREQSAETHEKLDRIIEAQAASERRAHERIDGVVHRVGKVETDVAVAKERSGAWGAISGAISALCALALGAMLKKG